MLLLAGTHLSAQTVVKTVEKEVFFEVYFVYQVHDTVIAYIKGNDGLDIKKGTSATAYQAYAKSVDGSEPDRNFKAVGSGRVVQADSATGCLIKLNKASEKLREGDMIALKMNVPAGGYRSIFADLVFNKIIFYGCSI